jgi:hypothetical protein
VGSSRFVVRVYVRSAVVLVAGVVSALAAGCNHKASVGPGPIGTDPFTLAPGQSAVIGGTSLRLQFLEVASDSRCPVDAVCIQAGDASLRVRVYDGSATTDYVLHTNDRGGASVSHRGVSIELLQLLPLPLAGRTIAPSEYRATFAVRR